MLRKRYLLVFVAIMLGIGLAAVDNYTKDLSEQASEVLAQNPDYYGKNLVNRSYDADGILVTKFSADSSTNYPSEKITEFNQPVVLVADKKQTFWQIKAQQAVMHQVADKTVFNRQVKIVPLEDNDNNLVINTEKLNFHTKKSLVENKQPITVISDSGVISAVGMEMDMTTDKLIFLSKVKARYDNPLQTNTSGSSHKTKESHHE